MPQKKMAGPATGPATEDASTQYSAAGDPNELTADTSARRARKSVSK